MSELNSQNLDVITAEVDYRHRRVDVAVDRHRIHGRRWLRRDRKAGEPTA